VTACEFCRIVRGEEAARVVCSTSDTLAFFPLEPAALGHTLIVPRKHVRDLWSADPQLASSLMATVIQVGRALDKALHPDGMNLISSAGEAASQSIFHLHLHLIPRWANDHIRNLWPPSEPWGEEVKDEVADLVRDACLELGS
jgi:histidine triad (HIT) family protein